MEECGNILCQNCCNILYHVLCFQVSLRGKLTSTVLSLTKNFLGFLKFSKFGVAVWLKKRISLIKAVEAHKLQNEGLWRRINYRMKGCRGV